MNFNRVTRLCTILAIIPVLSGCWLAVAAGAGAYGGYKMKENGYSLQNPVTKKNNTQNASD